MFRPAWLRRHWAALTVAGVVAVSAGATVSATTRTSTTFDEIVMLAGGARGWATGHWDIQPDHPPMMQYLYGLPVYLTRPDLPDVGTAPSWRDSTAMAADAHFSFRYDYARDLFSRAGNDPERMAFVGRLVGALMAALLALSAFRFTTARYGPIAGTIAATLIAFLPDLLGHGGVAYNDVPIALAWFLAVWAADRAARAPTVRTGAVFGLAAAFALSVKFSAVVIGPAALVIVLLEGVAARASRDWIRRISVAGAAALVAAYVGLVVVYRGDLLLGQFRYGVNAGVLHAAAGHGAPGFLLGEIRQKGWWYFYPVAYLFKTPVAFQLLLTAGVIGLAASWGRDRPGLRNVLRSELRAPLVGFAVFGGAVLAARLDIGFRYALPAFAPLCVIAGVGLARTWERRGRWIQTAIGAGLAWQAVSVLSWWPHYLAYTSEYVRDRDDGSRVLLDSSLDWGQELIDLRHWMTDRGVDCIYLSYFGSAVPAAYGIQYIPVPAFHPLPWSLPTAAKLERPKYVAISATNLRPIYLAADPFARFRARTPVAVIGHAMMIYEVDGPTTAALDTLASYAISRLGEGALAQGALASADSMFQRATEFNPSDSRAWTGLGMVNAKMGHVDAAVAALRRAVALDPEATPTQSFLGRILTETGQPTEAVRFLEDVGRRPDATPLDVARLSMAYAAAGRDDDAVDAAHAALGRESGDARVLVVAGRALFTAGKFAEAERLLASALQQDQADIPTMMVLADVEVALGRPDVAIRIVQHVLSVDPDNAVARAAMGRLLKPPRR